jgi:hypothetical protein
MRPSALTLGTLAAAFHFRFAPRPVGLMMEAGSLTFPAVFMRASMSVPLVLRALGKLFVMMRCPTPMRMPLMVSGMMSGMMARWVRGLSLRRCRWRRRFGGRRQRAVAAAVLDTMAGLVALAAFKRACQQQDSHHRQSGQNLAHATHSTGAILLQFETFGINFGGFLQELVNSNRSPGNVPRVCGGIAQESPQTSSVLLASKVD